MYRFLLTVNFRFKHFHAYQHTLGVGSFGLRVLNLITVAFIFILDHASVGLDDKSWIGSDDITKLS